NRPTNTPAPRRALPARIAGFTSVLTSPNLRSHCLTLPRRHATEADVGHAGVRARAVPGAGPVARAITVVAQKRSAFLHSSGLERGQGVLGLGGADGFDDNALVRPPTVQVTVVPIGAPLPDVPGHVVETVAVGRVTLDRSSALEAVFG